MERAKWLLGLGPAPGTTAAAVATTSSAPAVHPLLARQAESQQSASERLQEQIQAQRLNVEAAQLQQARAQREAALCRERGDRKRWEYWKGEEALHRDAEAQWQSKLKFSEDQLRIQQNAASNLQTGLILKDGEAELASTTAAMKTLKVEDTIDKIRGHAELVDRHNELFVDRLQEPSVAQREASLEWDDEWDRGRAQQVADQLPTVPAAATAGTTGKAVAARDEIKTE